MSTANGNPDTDPQPDQPATAAVSSDTTSYVVTTTATVTERTSSTEDTGLPGFSIGSVAATTSGVTSTSSHSTSEGSAAAETTTAASTSRSSSNGGGYSSGEIAGAAVGSAIGAALLTFLITLFLCGRRGRSKGSQQRIISDPGFSEKGSRGAGVAAWQAYLPQSADDGTLRNAVKTLFDQVELHVDNFYQANEARWDANTSQAIRQIDSGKLSAPIEELFQTPRTTLAVIKHCIAYDLINSISPSLRPEISLLPARLAVLPPKLQEQSTSLSRDGAATREAYSQWKLLNSFLFPNPKSDPSYKMDRDVSSSDVADSLCSIFQPWQARQQNPEAAKQNTKGLATTAADLGVLIMSQASTYEFKWSTSRQEGGNISRSALVKFPGFLKVADDQGKSVEPAQILLPSDVFKL